MVERDFVVNCPFQNDQGMEVDRKVVRFRVFYVGLQLGNARAKQQVVAHCIYLAKNSPFPFCIINDPR